MLIVNKSNTDASWFCYNSNDRDRAIALASGNLGKWRELHIRPSGERYW